jgi:hypothetical protein
VRRARAPALLHLVVLLDEAAAGAAGANHAVPAAVAVDVVPFADLAALGPAQTGDFVSKGPGRWMRWRKRVMADSASRSGQRRQEGG